MQPAGGGRRGSASRRERVRARCRSKTLLGRAAADRRKCVRSRARGTCGNGAPPQRRRQRWDLGARQRVAKAGARFGVAVAKPKPLPVRYLRAAVRGSAILRARERPARRVEPGPVPSTMPAKARAGRLPPAAPSKCWREANRSSCNHREVRAWPARRYGVTDLGGVVRTAGGSVRRRTSALSRGRACRRQNRT